MKAIISALVLLGTLVLGGCASGPQFDKAEGTIAPLAAGKGRVFIYRSSAVGGLIQPDVKLNGVVVGSATPHGVFYVDKDPGNISIVIGTEVEKTLTFTLGAGEVRYVKCGVNMGILAARIIPELVDPADAKKEMSDLAFTGGK